MIHQASQTSAGTSPALAQPLVDVLSARFAAAVRERNFSVVTIPDDAETADAVNDCRALGLDARLAHTATCHGDMAVFVTPQARLVGARAVSPKAAAVAPLGSLKEFQRRLLVRPL